jgi:hypothetical protein
MRHGLKTEIPISRRPGCCLVQRQPPLMSSLTVILALTHPVRLPLLLLLLLLLGLYGGQLSVLCCVVLCCVQLGRCWVRGHLAVHGHATSMCMVCASALRRPRLLLGLLMQRPAPMHHVWMRMMRNGLRLTTRSQGGLAHASPH